MESGWGCFCGPEVSTGRGILQVGPGALPWISRMGPGPPLLCCVGLGKLPALSEP